MLQIEASTKITFNLQNNLYGFAGNNYPSGRKKLKQSADLLRIKSAVYLILLLHNPALIGFHLPQDAVAISLGKKDTLTFGLADGVSLVNGIINNSSGILALELISLISNLTQHNWHRQLKLISEKWRRIPLPAASTLVWGSFVKIDSTYKLKLLLVGSPADMGILKLITETKVLTLQNHSSGFVPYHYSPDIQELVVFPSSTLVCTTDGVWLSDTTLRQLVHLHRIKPPLAKIAKFLKDNIPPSRDDQSLLLITLYNKN